MKKCACVGDYCEHFAYSFITSQHIYIFLLYIFFTFTDAHSYCNLKVNSTAFFIFLRHNNVDTKSLLLGNLTADVTHYSTRTATYNGSYYAIPNLKTKQGT